MVFGLALVAYSEEIVFRRCARHLFQIYLNDGYALVVVTSILFGALVDRHWEYCRGCIDRRFVEAALPSISSALAGCGHYLTDIVDFGL